MSSNICLSNCSYNHYSILNSSYYTLTHINPRTSCVDKARTVRIDVTIALEATVEGPRTVPWPLLSAKTAGRAARWPHSPLGPHSVYWTRLGVARLPLHGVAYTTHTRAHTRTDTYKHRHTHTRLNTYIAQPWPYSLMIPVHVLTNTKAISSCEVGGTHDAGSITAQSESGLSSSTTVNRTCCPRRPCVPHQICTCHMAQWHKSYATCHTPLQDLIQILYLPSEFQPFSTFDVIVFSDIKVVSDVTVSPGSDVTVLSTDLLKSGVIEQVDWYIQLIIKMTNMLIPQFITVSNQTII